MNTLKLLFVVTILFTPSTVFGQTLESKLAQQVELFNSEKTSPLEQLIEVAQKFQIPIGIECEKSFQEKTDAPIHLKHTTLQEVFRVILSQHPGYEFKLNDGVVHIFSVALVNDERNFLNLKIPHIQVEDRLLYAAQYTLRAKIEVSLGRRLSGVRAKGYISGWNSCFDRLQVNFSEKNLTVRQILNVIAVKQTNILWVVCFNPSELMEGAPPFFAQIDIPENKITSYFCWNFMGLDENFLNHHPEIRNQPMPLPDPEPAEEVPEELLRQSKKEKN